MPHCHTEYTGSHLHTLLQKAINEEISHKELADWCCAYCCPYWSDSLEGSQGARYEVGLPIAMDIDDQWELFLLNTYTAAELARINLSKVKLPLHWLHNWLNTLKQGMKREEC